MDAEFLKCHSRLSGYSTFTSTTDVHEKAAYIAAERNSTSFRVERYRRICS
jgi:hypothetical protein